MEIFPKLLKNVNAVPKMYDEVFRFFYKQISDILLKNKKNSLYWIRKRNFFCIDKLWMLVNLVFIIIPRNPGDLVECFNYFFYTQVSIIKKIIHCVLIKNHYLQMNGSQIHVKKHDIIKSSNLWLVWSIKYSRKRVWIIFYCTSGMLIFLQYYFILFL